MQATITATFLVKQDVQRFSVLGESDRLEIAKAIRGGLSPSYVQQILAGKLRVVSPVAKLVVAAAEKKLAAK